MVVKDRFLAFVYPPNLGKVMIYLNLHAHISSTIGKISTIYIHLPYLKGPGMCGFPSFGKPLGNLPLLVCESFQRVYINIFYIMRINDSKNTDAIYYNTDNNE